MSDVVPFVKVDYDGVMVVPQKDSFSIMRESLGDVLTGKLSYMNRFEMIDWKDIFARKTGTTELGFVLTVLDECKVKMHEKPGLFWKFVARRAHLVREFNRERGINKFDDGAVFSDAQVFLENVKTVFPESIVALVTGNPGLVIEERLPEELRRYFDFWIGGEYGNTRGDMVNAAIKHAEEFHGWKPKYDMGGGMINSFYIDDSLTAVGDVLSQTSSRVIWLPRRIGRGFESTEELWMALDKRFSINETQNLYFGREATARDGRTFFPRVMISHTLTDESLLDPSHKYYKGFLDPAFHLKYVENARIWLEMESPSMRERV